MPSYTWTGDLKEPWLRGPSRFVVGDGVERPAGTAGTAGTVTTVHLTGGTFESCCAPPTTITNDELLSAWKLAHPAHPLTRRQEFLRPVKDGTPHDLLCGIDADGWLVTDINTTLVSCRRWRWLPWPKAQAWRVETGETWIPPVARAIYQKREPIQPDRKVVADGKVHKADPFDMFKRGEITFNELRRLDGLPPIPDAYYATVPVAVPPLSPTPFRPRNRRRFFRRFIRGFGA